MKEKGHSRCGEQYEQKAWSKKWSTEREKLHLVLKWWPVKWQVIVKKRLEREVAPGMMGREQIWKHLSDKNQEDLIINKKHRMREMSQEWLLDYLLGGWVDGWGGHQFGQGIKGEQWGWAGWWEGGNSVLYIEYTLHCGWHCLWDVNRHLQQEDGWVNPDSWRNMRRQVDLSFISIKGNLSTVNNKKINDGLISGPKGSPASVWQFLKSLPSHRHQREGLFDPCSSSTWCLERDTSRARIRMRQVRHSPQVWNLSAPPPQKISNQDKWYFQCSSFLNLN